MINDDFDYSDDNYDDIDDGWEEDVVISNLSWSHVVYSGHTELVLNSFLKSRDFLGCENCEKYNDAFVPSLSKNMYVTW